MRRIFLLGLLLALMLPSDRLLPSLLTPSVLLPAGADTLALASAGPIKRASSAIAITSDGGVLLVVNPDSNSLALRWSGEWDESADSEFANRKENFGSGLIDGDMNCSLSPPDCVNHPPNQGHSYDLDCLRSRGPVGHRHQAKDGVVLAGTARP